MNHRTTLCGAVIAFLVAPSFAQTTRLVPSQYPTIQTAINASVNGDSIVVAPGSYSGTVNFSGKTLMLTSSGGSAVTTLFGIASSPVVTFQGGEGPATSFQGFRVTGGGPGIYVHNASPQISNCLINLNYAPSGAQAAAGGIRTTIDAGTGSPTITNCTIADNLGWRGGGLSFETGGTGTSSPAVIGCQVTGNSAIGEAGNNNAGSGGGVLIEGSVQAAIVTTAINDNVASSDGAVHTGGPSSTLIDRCQLVGNQANFAGAISTGGTCTIVGTLIASNTTFSGTACSNCYSGGLNLGGTVTIQSCTISGNERGFGTTGGIFASGSLTITDSIVWGNGGFDVFRHPITATVNAAYSDIGTASFVVTSPNISADPLFVDAAHGDFHIASISPCRNAGSPSLAGLPPTDFDGGPRVVGSLVDIGVDEFPALTFPGTADGLDLSARVNGTGDPLASTRAAAANSHLTVTMKSASPSLVGGLPLFAGEVFPNGSPPTPLAPGIWLDYSAIIVYGAVSAPPFGFPGLPAAGLTFDFTVPPGLAGNTVRFQGFVSTATALNGSLATSNATEVTF